MEIFDFETLDKIKSPADFRGMNIDDLHRLAKEVRGALLLKVAAHGGHVGPNLGMVEAIIAIHYVFNTPEDKIIFDVSHQTYPHKILTGRAEAFTNPAHYDEVTGYTNPQESEYDLFSLGHTSSAVAIATGVAKARDLRGGKENVVAVIGDGSLSGGVAFEGLDFGATLGSNFIVVVNDNDMSIAENHGGIYADLRLLRNTNGTAEPNLFRAMGYAYRYVHYGNDLRSLIEMFRAVKDIKYPVVVHLNTMKGMGYAPAESDKERFHWSMPFDLSTGNLLNQEAEEAPDYSDIFSDEMLRMMKEDPMVVTMTAGTPGVLGFTPEKRKSAGRQFIDVGIAEQQGVDMAAGLAEAGAKPVFGLVSSFLQRAYDQFAQDAALNRQPATFVVFHGSLFGMNDETHLGFFDIALLGNIPNLILLAPTCSNEFISMLRWAVNRKNSTTPVVIRIPGGAPVDNPAIELLEDYSVPKYEIVKEGTGIALIGAGTFFGNMQKATSLLAEKGIKATLINPRNISNLDKEALDNLRDYKVVITAEDGIVEGGFGQKIASYLGDTDVKVVNLGLPKKFLNKYKAGEIARECRLMPEQIAEIAQNF